MSKPWTQAENEAVIMLYFGMLGRAKSGAAYSKAAMIRDAQVWPYGESVEERGVRPEFPPLGKRSKGSIEFKLMNCSACHADLISDDIKKHGKPLGLDTILGRDTMHGHGYRALSNYQADLKATMSKVLAGEL